MHTQNTNRARVHISFICHLTFLLSLACSARDPFFTFSQDPHFPACILIFLIGILFPSGSIFPISHTFSTEILFPSYYITFPTGIHFLDRFSHLPRFLRGKKNHKQAMGNMSARRIRQQNPLFRLGSLFTCCYFL